MIFTKRAKRLLLLCLVPFLVYGCSKDEEASSAQDPRAAEVRNAAKLKQLTSGLSLTPEQQAKVKALFAEESAAIEKINTEASRNGTERVKQIIGVRTNTYEKIRPLLTPEQSAKFDDQIAKLEGRKKRR